MEPMESPPSATATSEPRTFFVRAKLGRRLLYLALALIVVALGLASRKYREALPVFVGEYAGDTLWALMVYLLISTLAAGRSIAVRATAALTFAVLIEFSQLYHAPWIDAIRATTLGALVLGRGFLATDLVCYAVGIGVGAAIEAGVRRYFAVGIAACNCD